MRVTSDLADLQIKLGRIRREGRELVVESAPGSSLDACIRVDAGEALHLMGKLLSSGAVWAFLVRLPFALLLRIAGVGRKRVHFGHGEAATPFARGRESAGDNPAWRARRESTGLNKPW